MPDDKPIPWDDVERMAMELGAERFRVLGDEEERSTVWFVAAFRGEDARLVEVLSPAFENVTAMTFIEGFEAGLVRAFLADLAERLRRRDAVRAFRSDDGSPGTRVN